MTLNDDTLRFIRLHRCDDVRALALQARKYPAVDMPAAITQIAGWQSAKEKIPSWAQVDDLLYPAHLSLEQCSSEATARYKAEIIRRHQSGHETLTDLTGGFGIDCFFLSACFRHTTYVERQEALCRIAAHNFPLLGGTSIRVCHDDSLRHLHAMPPADWIFIDPARRDGHGGKTVAIGDCEPDVSALEDLLLEKAPHVLIKLSPMLDLTLALHDMKHVQEAHVVSIGNECKELLLVLERESCLPADEIPVHCINLASSPASRPLTSSPEPRPLTSSPTPRPLTFTRAQERESACPCTSSPKAYLYEPNASLLKAGAFRRICSIYKVEKLHPNSHLYTSDEYLPHFPGRKFRIVRSYGFSKKEMKELSAAEKKANITVRNFPASVAELRKRLKLAEGGDTYLFATTLADEKKILISCRIAIEKR